MVWNTNFSISPWGTLSLGPLEATCSTWTTFGPSPLRVIPTELDWNPTTGSEKKKENENVYFPPLPPPLNFSPPLGDQWGHLGFCHEQPVFFIYKGIYMYTKNPVCTAFRPRKEDSWSLPLLGPSPWGRPPAPHEQIWVPTPWGWSQPSLVEICRPVLEKKTKMCIFPLGPHPSNFHPL